MSRDTIINNLIEKTKEFILQELIPIIQKSGEPLEGNLFMEHHHTTFTNNFSNKQKNLVDLLLDSTEIKKVLEIGFNAGFSALLMLETNPSINLTCVDIGQHKYTKPCFDKIQEKFGNRIQLKIGDSTKVLPRIQDKFDMIHIDGAHDVTVATNDIINSYHLALDNSIMIMDDYNGDLEKLWDSYVQIFNLQHVNLTYDTNVGSSPHDVKRVSK